MNLYEKIQAVADEVKNISKDMTVGTGSYSYKAVSDIDVTLKVKKAETKFKIVSIPFKQELISSETIRESKTTRDETKETIRFSFVIKMTTRFIDLEDTTQFIEVESFGHGLDSGDKSFGKASTYARKYALLNAYKIATGEDPDAGKPELVTPISYDEKRVAVENYFAQNNDSLQKMLSHFNIGSSDDFTKQNIEQIYGTYKARKLI